MLRSDAPRRAPGRVLQLVLGLYVLAAAFLPLGHHDIACHLKSTTHCSTCVVGSSAESASHGSPLQNPALDDAGASRPAVSDRVADPYAGSSSGRSPPTA